MVGLIGKKRGMTQIFDGTGESIPVTVIEAGPCTVVQAKNAATDGYAAVQVGFGERKAQRVSKAYRTHCLKADKGVFLALREFRTSGDDSFSVGQQLKVDELFKPGDYVDVTGTTKGRGFSGVIKRHGFSGFPASHGTHETFRHGGSIGNRSYPGRVFKGKRMAGQYGADTVTTLNLKVVAVRPAEGLLLVRGAVPGSRNGLVIIRQAVKRVHRG